MVNANLLQQIEIDIDKAYGNRDEPVFTFVKTAIRKRPYLTVLDCLGHKFKVEDTSDLNNDVSLMLVLRSEYQKWIVGLSLAGPYCFVGKLNDSDCIAYLLERGANENSILNEERDILRCLALADTITLTERVLETNTRLNLPGSLSGLASVYQALFTDTDVFPWASN